MTATDNTYQSFNTSLSTATLLDFLVKNAPIVLWAIDSDGVFRLSDGKGLSRLGIKPDEVIGRSVFDVYAHVPQICQECRRALAGEEFVSIVLVEGVTFQSTYRPIRDAQDKVGGVLGLAIDITYQLQATESLQHRQRLLEAVYSVDRSTAEILDLEAILKMGLEAALRAINCEAGAIFLRESLDSNLMRATYTTGLSNDTVRQIREMRLGEGVSGTALAERRVIIMDASEYSLNRLLPYLIKEGVQVIASAPLIASGQVLGALTVATRRPQKWGDVEKELLTSLGIQMGSAVYRANLYQELQKQHQELENRMRELSALNNLFQRYLQERDEKEASEAELKSAVQQFLTDLDVIIARLRSRAEKG